MIPFLIWGLFALAQAAGPDTQPSLPADPRIRVMAYVPDQVVPLQVASGFATVVELAPDERIETIVAGNSDGWQVTPNRTGNRLVIKALGSAATTNLVVLTDARRYVFLIGPEQGGVGTFVMRFTYPGTSSANMVTTLRAADYRLNGDKALFPIAIGDDGRRTTVTWDRQASLPAIFAIDRQGKEMLVNGRMTGDDYVIEGIASRYMFRLGKNRAIATRTPIRRP